MFFADFLNLLYHFVIGLLHLAINPPRNCYSYYTAHDTTVEYTPHMHICGQMKNVYPQAELIHSDVLSFDSCVSMREAREHLKKHALMGNVSTWTLEFGQPEKVEQLAVKCWRDGSNIISPACGLGTKSPLTNIQAIRHGIMEEAANV